MAVDEEPATAGTQARRLRIAGLAASLLVASSFVWWQTRPDPKPIFCKAGGVIIEIDGREVWPEDQGAPGPDHCDGSKVMSGAWALGFDCKLRAPGGRVVRSLTPNRDDGTCGQPDPGGSWPT
jgi:hypothetical protein